MNAALARELLPVPRTPQSRMWLPARPAANRSIASITRSFCRSTPTSRSRGQIVIRRGDEAGYPPRWRNRRAAVKSGGGVRERRKAFEGIGDSSQQGSRLLGHEAFPSRSGSHCQNGSAPLVFRDFERGLVRSTFSPDHQRRQNDRRPRPRIGPRGRAVRRSAGFPSGTWSAPAARRSRRPVLLHDVASTGAAGEGTQRARSAASSAATQWCCPAGLIGKVTRVEDAEIGLEVAQNVTVKVGKNHGLRGTDAGRTRRRQRRLSLTARDPRVTMLALTRWKLALVAISLAFGLIFTLPNLVPSGTLPSVAAQSDLEPRSRPSGWIIPVV